MPERNPGAKKPVRTSRSPPPITPSRGGGRSTANLAPPLARKPNWRKWRQMLTTEVWKAVALSLDIEPGEMPGLDFHPIDGDPFDDCPREYRDRLDIACDHVRNGKLECTSRASSVPQSSVRLTDFVSWAHLLGWALPSLFPIADTTLAPRKVAAVRQGALDCLSYPEAIKTAGKVLFGFEWVGPPSAHENVVQKLGPAHPDWSGMVHREQLRNAQSSEVDAWLYKRGLIEESKSVARFVRGERLRKALADELDIPASTDGATMDTEPYWTLAETVLWILTRDASRVAAVPRPAVDDGLPHDSAVMEELLKLAPEMPDLASESQIAHPDQWEELPNGVGFLAQGEIFEDLARRVRAGEVKARGQRPGLNDSEGEPIAPSRWDTLVFQSMPDGLCGVLSKTTLWVRVQFRRSEVTAWWPPKGELAPRPRQGTFSFGEIADEVARLNAGSTREAVLTRLEKSFEEGEFERDGESAVLFEGPVGQWWPRSREFLTTARDMPGYERLHRVAFRLSNNIIREWCERWEYRLPLGFIEATGNTLGVAAEPLAVGDQPAPKPTRALPRQAPQTEIEVAITAAYDAAARANAKPPNIKELAAAVKPLLASKGYQASGNQIQKLAAAPQHAQRRRKPGKTVASELIRRRP